MWVLSDTYKWESGLSSVCVTIVSRLCPSFCSGTEVGRGEVWGVGTGDGGRDPGHLEGTEGVEGWGRRSQQDRD